jgi:hypothetical protein
MNLRDYARSIIREHTLVILNLRREIHGLLPEGHAAAVGALRAQRRNRATAGDYLRLRTLDRELRAAKAATGPQRHALTLKIRHDHAWRVHFASCLLAYLRGRGPALGRHALYLLRRDAERAKAPAGVIEALAALMEPKPAAAAA